ncbi:MAG: phage holin family protein [Alphaproteobacteria bacterium]|nr:phage holin family protein [Alphaproteobacteria bacterium]MBU1279546.1 phage holin family protein [Alphaproteobacteria bacterium]MBU1574450.1 phage holin family protein [Alphaproteobacteria bacterium]MBU1829756.1 phage holin family protein [Alphaproteobacteria bacterium]MBU2077895.1 phage holin family protein [Alphaproteobacteria bacterium]
MFSSLLHRAERDVKDGARKLLWSALAVVIAGLTAGVGVCFVLLWAYMTLSAEVGPRMASLVMGLGLILCAAVILALSAHQARLERTKTPDPQPAPHRAPKPAPSDPDIETLPSLVAFTAAFVLARYLANRNADE